MPFDTLPPKHPPGSPLRLAAGLCGTLTAMLLGAAACDIPTEAPQWEQRWIVPADDTSLGVEEILPDNVALTLDRSAFSIQVEPVIVQESLGSLCPACVPLDGQLVPKPAFESRIEEEIPFPARVQSAEVREGRVTVQMVNGFLFDPLRPPGGLPGTFRLALHDGPAGGPVLDEVEINGLTTSFPLGATLTRTLEYSGPVGSRLTVTLEVSSPAGGPSPTDWVRIRISDRIQVTATVTALEVTSAVVDVSGESFDVIDTELDVGEVDQELVDHVQSGAFILDLSNPWAIGASMDLVINGPGMPAPVTKLVPIPPAPTAVVRVEFTQAELRSFLGKANVTMRGAGVVAPDAGAVTLTPTQVLTVETTLDLTLLVG